MATYTEIELVQMVMAKIEQIMPPGEGIEAGATIESPVAYIEQELAESANYILRQAPVIQVKQLVKKVGKHFPVGDPNEPDPNPDVALTYDSNTGISLVPLPVDFLRFVNILLSSWVVPVSELIPESDDKYRREKTIPVLRGNELKPRAALVTFNEYAADKINANFTNVGLAVECFSNKTEPTLTYLNYIPKTAPTKIPDDMRDAMLWECAGRTFILMDMKTRADAAFNQVDRYFSNKYGVITDAR